MIIYEVNVSVKLEIAEAYAAWLAPHIHEILALPGFVRAVWYERDTEPNQLVNHREWTVQYHIENRNRLEEYLQKDAPRLRQDALDRFGEKFLAQRRVLELVKEFAS